MRNRLLLIGAALAAFGASLLSGFHFDDYAIFSDRVLASSSGWTAVWNLRQTRPLTYLTLWMNWMAGGADPLGYHLLNLALHLGAVLLAYECFRRLLGERAALAAAAIFAVHPLQAEAVDYVWGRAIVLAALLCLASLMAWLDGKGWLAVAWFAAALLAKEECAAFPLVLLLLRRAGPPETPGGGGPPKRPGRFPAASQEAWPHMAMILLALAAGARVVWATAVTPGALAGFQAGISPWKYFLAQGPVILRYLRMFLVPSGFTVDPDIPIPAVWAGLLAWAAVAALAVWAWRKRELGWPLWLLAGLLLLAPSSSVFPAADLAADRRMYLPLIGFAAAAGLLLTRVRTAALAATVVAALAIGGLTRTLVWMDDASLWREAVRRAPHKARPKIQLSRAVRAGEALELLTAARVDAPYDPAIPAEMGKVLLQEHQVDAALDEFGRAIALDPKNARNFNNRGVAFGYLGLPEAARDDFLRAIEIDPGLTEARENLRRLPPPAQ
jgi:tetratricopeptide (TPR) repeat protein